MRSDKLSSADGTSATVPSFSPIIGAGTGPGSAINSAALASNQPLNAGCGRASLAATTTVYLVGLSVYTGTASANNSGWISGRRAR